MSQSTSQDISRPTRIVSLPSLGGLAATAAVALALSLATLLYVVYQEAEERSRQRLDDLTRLAAARIELRLDAAEPAFQAMAARAASMLVVEEPSAQTRADVARQIAALLPRSPAVSAGVFGGDGELQLEVGRGGLRRIGSLPWTNVQGEAQSQDQAQSGANGTTTLPIRFLDPLILGGEAMLPLAIRLDAAALSTFGLTEPGAIAFLLPANVIESWFSGALAQDGRVAGLLAGPRGEIFGRYSPEAFASVPPLGGRLANLPARSRVPLDGQVTLFGASGLLDGDDGIGETLGSMAVVPNRDLWVVLLTPAATVQLLLRDAGWLLAAAMLPAAALLAIFLYAVRNEWHREDRELDHLVSLSRRLRFATNLLDVGTIEWNVRTGDLVLSAGWHRLVGADPAIVLDEIEEWHARIHPDDRPHALARYQKLADGDYERLSHRLRILRDDGTVVPVVERGGLQFTDRGRISHVVLVMEPEAQGVQDPD
jgi:hypothetical protein